jgi:NADPH:quinone reductase-like Zn-dependent oxidoreductase
MEMTDPDTAGAPTTTMAARIFEHGGPEKLVYDEYELAPVGPGDVLVKVIVTSVSGWDIKYREGLPRHYAIPGRSPFPLPQQLGREAAGTVVAVGAQVAEFKVGDRVMAVVHPENPYSRETARGLGNLSTGIDIPGHQALGSYAQYVVRDQSLWLPVPDGVELEQAALTLWAYSTSHRIVADRLGVRLGETVIVAGASGGMGLATVALARLTGARTIALTRSADKAAALREIGVDEAMVITDCDAALAELRELTDGYGAEHAVDFTGDHDVLGLLVGGLALGGRLLVAAGEGGPQTLPIAIRQFVALELTVLGIRGARISDTRVVRDLMAAGRIHTPVAARFALRDIAQAHVWFEEQRDAIGRIVVDPWA